MYSGSQIRCPLSTQYPLRIPRKLRNSSKCLYAKYSRSIQELDMYIIPIHLCFLPLLKYILHKTQYCYTQHLVLPAILSRCNSQSPRKVKKGQCLLRGKFWTFWTPHKHMGAPGWHYLLLMAWDLQHKGLWPGARMKNSLEVRYKRDKIMQSCGRGNTLSV